VTESKASQRPPSEIERVHERLDDLFEANNKLFAGIERIEQRCEPCQKMLARHDTTLHGNGKDGLVVRMTAAEHGRVDTLSVKSVCTLIAAVGALAAAIGSAMAALIS